MVTLIKLISKRALQQSDASRKTWRVTAKASVYISGKITTYGYSKKHHENEVILRE